MSGCWWQCMESTPRVEKTFLSRERATFLTSSNKVHTLEKSWWWNKITLYLDNEELLEQFINNEEPKYFNKEKQSKRKRAEVENEEFEPEEAFLKIGSNLRQVLLLSFIPFPCWVWFIPDLGAEAPAAIGDAPGHRGKTWRHLLHQSQHWIRCGGPVKVKNSNSMFWFISEDFKIDRTHFSFERLLLHATCAYYALNSYSFDFGGRRLVRVENPWGK